MNVHEIQPKCKHAGCRCPVEEEGRYCSEHCRKADERAGNITGETGPHACGCGHPECEEAVRQ